MRDSSTEDYNERGVSVAIRAARDPLANIDVLDVQIGRKKQQHQ